MRAEAEAEAVRAPPPNQPQNTSADITGGEVVVHKRQFTRFFATMNATVANLAHT